MGMTTLSELFPQASSLPGGMTKDPRLMPFFQPSGDGTGSVLYDAGAALSPNALSYWQEVAKRGAYATGVADDTYKEICDITGSGILFHVIAPAYTNSTDDVTFKITVDGVEYIIVKTTELRTAGSERSRLVLGACVSNGRASQYTSANAFVYEYAGIALSNDLFTCDTGQMLLLPPDQIRTNGLPMLRFEESLKVEVKVTDVHTGTYSGYCGATYILD
jgi:hypothetical protein